MSPIPIPTPWPVPPSDPEMIDVMAQLLKLEYFENVVSIAQGVVVMVADHNNVITAVVVVGVIIAAVRWFTHRAHRSDNEV